MKLVVDGRTIELDESVDRVVIERLPGGTLAVSSHFGIKREVVTRDSRLKIDHTAFVGPAKSNNTSENGHGRSHFPMGALGNRETNNRPTASVKPRMQARGVLCQDCQAPNHSRQHNCTSCGGDLTRRFKQGSH